MNLDSRVTCNNCGEKGHTKVRCKKDPAPIDDGGFGDGGFGESTQDWTGGGDANAMSTEGWADSGAAVPTTEGWAGGDAAGDDGNQW